jgi:hypothetical protein
MRTREHLAVFAIGVASATAFHLSCGDGESPSADAMVTCDCPTAEPPLAARLVRVTAQKEGAPMSNVGLTAVCTFGQIVISGGCQTRSSSDKVVLKSSFAAAPESPDAWACEFFNGTASPVNFEAYVLCLKPAT